MSSLCVTQRASVRRPVLRHEFHPSDQGSSHACLYIRVHRRNEIWSEFVLLGLHIHSLTHKDGSIHIYVLF